jgi:ADP-ribose pyrophosphatase YjhB (NUDIX family)
MNITPDKGSGEGWSLPARAIELGETPEQAIEREVLEETGLTVIRSEVLAVFGGREFRYTYPNGDQVKCLVVLFRCLMRGEAGGYTDTETIRLKYTSFDEMPKLALLTQCSFCSRTSVNPVCLSSPLRAACSLASAPLLEHPTAVSSSRFRT